MPISIALEEAAVELRRIAKSEASRQGNRMIRDEQFVEASWKFVDHLFAIPGGREELARRAEFLASATGESSQFAKCFAAMKRRLDEILTDDVIRGVVQAQRDLERRPSVERLSEVQADLKRLNQKLPPRATQKEKDRRREQIENTQELLRSLNQRLAHFDESMAQIPHRDEFFGRSQIRPAPIGFLRDLFEFPCGKRQSRVVAIETTEDVIQKPVLEPYLEWPIFSVQIEDISRVAQEATQRWSSVELLGSPPRELSAFAEEARRVWEICRQDRCDGCRVILDLATSAKSHVVSDLAFPWIVDAVDSLLDWAQRTMDQRGIAHQSKPEVWVQVTKKELCNRLGVTGKTLRKLIDQNRGRIEEHGRLARFIRMQQSLLIELQANVESGASPERNRS